ncbi:MAG: depupylase/deamidase Dop [Corynebacterium sp.]|nr:depupylase/deamidase Dop [Corynebacterium sp.]
MSTVVPRALGTEVEYGILAPSQPAVSPIITSSHVVVAYAAHTAYGHTQWDFAGESPLKDQRGFDLRRYHTVPNIGARQVGQASLMVANGARFYVDHAHPEYSSPETFSAADATLWDAAGVEIMRRSVAAVDEFTARGESALTGHPPAPVGLKIYRNNVDGKGASYGAHENYLYSRELDFTRLAAGLTPFLATRQVFAGAGRIGIGVESETAGFQISQRADYIATTISLETTLNRGIINTRDEPHTDGEQFGRLHVIIGDANMSQTATYLKLGSTSLVLDALEADIDFSDLELADPVGAVHAISHDPTLSVRVPLRDGRELTGVEIQREYHARVRPVSDDARAVWQRWGEVLDLLATDPAATAHLLDWTAKLALLEGFRRRGMAWSDPKLSLVDLQYHDIDPAKSLYSALVRRGQMVEMFDHDRVVWAADNPPETSRAYFRGRVMDLYGAHVRAVNWAEIVLADPDIVVDMSEVSSFTAADTEMLVADEPEYPGFVRRLEQLLGETGRR